jgi:hypothetical protein
LCRECTARSEALPKEKATGLAVIVGGAEEAILSPLYWILAIAFFTLLMAASRLHKKALRASLFWTPTIIVTALAVGVSTLVAYVYVRYRQG